ncbi:mitochondrial inner membrane protein OXA1-like [Musa troglodytarum]|uniref:Mitochondrial inner membrane protein OXA1-like n=1 Tax=Musa troglodytarum TaxID=320322 RepID=A0A9E7KWL3_9LILI|nr:mitochondrial inner membrane protein OXA1-like [Musa troglodytarum]URE32091.1 mitochondrial inner membrane protein OXA1-like [Musa troglodytarum]
MACGRRSLTSNFTRLTRRFHPSFAHILRDDREDTEPSNPLPLPPSPSRRHASSSAPSVSGSGRWRSLGFSLPFGLEPGLLRSYSSGAEGSNEINYIKDVAEVLSDSSVETATMAAAAVPTPFPGEVAAAAADSFLPVAALQHLIDAVHSFSGLNWWASIVLTTLLIRGVTVPLLLNQMKATVKLNVMRPELEQLKEQINISNMVEKVPSFKGGGALWFTDLTTPDPRYMLPALTGLTFLATVELNMQEGMEGNPMANTMKKFSRVLAFMTVPFTANFPKAIFCYWITSNLFSLGYGFVLKLTRVRKFLNLPDLVPEPTKSAAQPNFTLFGASKPILPAKEESDQTNTPARRLSSSSVISQRIRNLEKTVKARNKHKKR